MDSTLDKSTTLPDIDTAVIVTSGPAATGQGLGLTPVSGVTAVGGVPLFQRAVLTMQRAGIRQVLVLAGEDEERLRCLVKDDPRLTIPVRWRPAREFPPQEPRTWQALASEVRGACMVVWSDTVFTKELVERLRQEVRSGASTLVVQPAETLAGDAQNGPRSDALGRGSASPVSSGNPGRVAGEMMVIPASLMARCGDTEACAVGAGRSSRYGGPGVGPASPLGATPLSDLLDTVATTGGVRTVKVSLSSPAWLHVVRDREGARFAERALLQPVHTELDGWVDRYFNRYLSTVLTRLFLKTGLSPNAITIVSMLIGLLGAATLATGSYTAGILGALLLQLSVVVDCCDGEVARVTFRESPFGEKLDILVDNVVHMAVFAGVALAVFLQQGGTAGSWVPLLLGGSAMVGNACSFWMVMRTRALKKRQAWTDSRQAARWDFILRHMVSRDFSAVLLGFALFHALHWFLWMAAIGANVFWIALAWLTRPSSLARTPA